MDMNNRPMKGYGNQTRAERFCVFDAPTLSALPLVVTNGARVINPATCLRRRGAGIILH